MLQSMSVMIDMTVERNRPVSRCCRSVEITSSLNSPSQLRYRIANTTTDLDAISSNRGSSILTRHLRVAFESVERSQTKAMPNSPHQNQQIDIDDRRLLLTRNEDSLEYSDE